MLLLIVYSVIISIGYCCLLIDYNRVWNDRINSKLSDQDIDFPFFSVIIVSRDEPQLKACVQSIYYGSYPKDHYEIIIVDDHSKQGALQEIIDLKIPIIRIFNLGEYDIPDHVVGFKKYGQHLAVTEAKYDWIVSTDGDCVCPPDWLKTIAQYSNEYSVLTGPIKITGPSNILTRLQQFDVVGTMIGTNYGINKQYWYSANAANMAFRKQLFLEYREQVEQGRHASGDDIFLIQYAASVNAPIAFVKSQQAIVKTEGEHSWRDFYNQRIRWASKSSAYKDPGMQILIYGIGLYSLSLALMVIIGLHLWCPDLIAVGLISYVVKWIIDYWIFSRTANFFKLQYGLLDGFVLSGLHLLYFLVIGITSIFVSNYKWKGRTVR